MIAWNAAPYTAGILYLPLKKKKKYYNSFCLVVQICFLRNTILLEKRKCTASQSECAKTVEGRKGIISPKAKGSTLLATGKCTGNCVTVHQVDVQKKKEASISVSYRTRCMSEWRFSKWKWVLACKWWPRLKVMSYSNAKIFFSDRIFD